MSKYRRKFDDRRILAPDWIEWMRLVRPDWPLTNDETKIEEFKAFVFAELDERFGLISAAQIRYALEHWDMDPPEGDRRRKTDFERDLALGDQIDKARQLCADILVDYWDRKNSARIPIDELVAEYFQRRDDEFECRLPRTNVTNEKVKSRRKRQASRKLK